MEPDLQVDTGSLRLAAGRLADAAAQCRTHHPADLPAIPDAALGPTPLARETGLLVDRRAAQAFELADDLARAADDLALRVLSAADLFDRVEGHRSAGR